MENIWDLVEDGYKKLGQNVSQKEAILILGNSGSGKSSLVTLLALDNTKFMSIENIKGSHEFVLDDSGARIGHTISSTTKIPELIIDNTTNMVYYDCPGFNDNRSAAQDLASTFFLKYVTDNLESVKIIFTAIYGSLRAGLDKADLFQFLKHATELIKDLDKFKDSIALVVTKVETNPYFENGEYKFPTEDLVIQSIASYLEQVMSTLNERNTVANDDSDFNKRAVDFIKIILKKEGNVFRNIALFRKSDRFGAVSNNPILQNNKIRILNTINNIKYEAKTPSDFRYSIADSSKSMILRLGRDMDRKISVITEYITTRIEENFNKLESESDSIDKINMEIGDAFKKMTNVIEEVSKNLSTPLEYSKLLSDNFQVDQGSIEQLRYFNKFLDFIKCFSDDEAMTLPLKWTSPIHSYKEGAFKVKQTYYTFVSELYEKLSSYTIQRNLDKSYEYIHKLNESTDWPTIISSIENISKNTNIKFTDMVLLKESKFNPPKLNLVTNIINVTLNNNTNLECNNDNCIVTGDLIILSNIISSIVDRKTVKLFKIYASHKIFIDQDILLLGRKATLIIIAPIWEIMGRRLFNISGKNGDEWSSKKAENGFHSSSSNSIDGKHGKPGRPGGAAGSFFAIGDNFMNEGDLTVLANGALGGPGQDGGDGAKGNDGIDASEEPSSPSECPPNTFMCTVFKATSDCSFTETYFNSGIAGERGGTSGDGGVGGEGGQKGKVKIIGLNDKSKINIESNDGRNGTGGEKGTPGVGGRNSDGIKGEFACVKTTVSWGISISTKITSYKTSSKVLQRYNSGYAENGKSGIASHNTAGKQLKEISPKLPNTANIIAEYKSLLEHRLKAYFEIKQPTLKNFFEHIGKRDKRSVAATFEDVSEIYSVFDTPYATNSAISGKSPFSCIFSWLKNKALSIINENSIATISIGKDTKSNKINNWIYSHEAVFTTNYQVDTSINANLILADLVVRKLTKQKLTHDSAKIEEIDTKAVVLTIVNDIDVLVRDLEKELNLPDDTLSYDPLILMKDVNAAIHSGRFSNVIKSLSYSVGYNVA